MLFAAALLLPAEALAHKCDRTDNDRREASRVIADLTGEIDAMERAIIEALRLQTGQLSGYIAQSAKAVTGALDSQTKLQAQTAREVAETGAMMAHRPSRSACEAITGLTGLAGTQAATESARARAGITETGRIVGDRAVVERPGAAAGDAARFETLTKSYCNAERAGEDPALCRGGDALHGADLRAESLFDRRSFQRREGLQHPQHGGGAARTGAGLAPHGAAVALEEEHQRGLGRLVGILPEPGAVRVGGAEGGRHGFAQGAGIQRPAGLQDRQQGAGRGQQSGGG